MQAGKTAVSYKQYLYRRGYNYMTTCEVILRMVKKSFSEKSFCRFWRMWNPPTGYLCFLLYSFLSGSMRRPYLIFIIFIISGIIAHDFVIFLFTGSISIIFTITFALYSIIFNIEEWMVDRKKKWVIHHNQARPIPTFYFILMNMVLLSLPLFLGILVNYYVFPDSMVNNIFR